MNNQLQEDGSFINSIVGEGTSFRGELALNGLLRIDGDFSGSIQTSGKVLVGINGRAECTINAGTVVVGGVVKGNIYADEKVLILSTGMMIGNIYTPRLIAEEGVVLHGACLVQRGKRTDAKGEANAAGRSAPDSKGVFESAEEAEVGEDEASQDQAVYSGAAKGELGSWNA